MNWDRAGHAANSTDDYVFHQLIPYIGNKRKLLGLIDRALAATGLDPQAATFIDGFAGTGVVSRFARQLGFQVLANDWEPYSEIINRCYLEIGQAPVFFGSRSYASVLDELNALPPLADWVTDHLCPDDDAHFDVAKDRLFYMRKNGMRIDAIRAQIDAWDRRGDLTDIQRAALLAPLLYQCCYNSNTSGVFKGFHNGWGGQTQTALYRIMGDLVLRPALFLPCARDSRVTRMDAQNFAETEARSVRGPSIAYLDPPYNQHPYGSNYHVLNSVALWDKPDLSRKISGHGDKSAIRHDWRTQRRSAYNYKAEATQAYTKILATLETDWIATSYSTDGMIDLDALAAANVGQGDCRVFLQGYKRYRVSSQRYSKKPMNVEFILLTRKGAKPSQSAAALAESIRAAEADVIARHGV